MHAGAEAHGEAGRGEFLEDLEVDLVRLVTAAVLDVVGQAEQSRFREQGEDLAREESGVLLLGRLRGDLALRDVADERDQIPGLVRGQLTVHRLRGAVGHVDDPPCRARRRTYALGGAAPPGLTGAGSMVAIPGSRKLLTSGCAL